MTKKQIIETIQKVEKEYYRMLVEALEENHGKDNASTNLLRQRWGAINDLCISLKIPT